MVSLLGSLVLPTLKVWIKSDDNWMTEAKQMWSTLTFDRVNHELLILRLCYCCLGGNLYWFYSSLTDFHHITFLGATSDSLPAISGVSLRSILGPALFLFCISDIPNIVTKPKITMFAEDTELFKEIKSSNDTPALQENPTNLESWFIPFDASLKKSKCNSH